MSSTLNNILQQKLLEIQSQLPPFVKLAKDSKANFNDILAEQIDEYSDANNSSPDSIGNISYQGDYNELIDYAAKKYNISSAIIKAVIKAESN
jgi:soluble lytic murein transglycosylase-like protein